MTLTVTRDLNIDRSPSLEGPMPKDVPIARYIAESSIESAFSAENVRARTRVTRSLRHTPRCICSNTRASSQPGGAKT